MKLVWNSSIHPEKQFSNWRITSLGNYSLKISIWIKYDYPKFLSSCAQPNRLPPLYISLNHRITFPSPQLLHLMDPDAGLNQSIGKSVPKIMKSKVVDTRFFNRVINGDGKISCITVMEMVCKDSFDTTMVAHR